MSLDRDDPLPLYRQLAGLIRSQITSGAIPPRRAIPSKHKLAAAHGVSIKTVDAALALLIAEGRIEPVHGKGYYVLPQPGDSPDPPT